MLPGLQVLKYWGNPHLLYTTFNISCFLSRNEWKGWNIDFLWTISLQERFWRAASADQHPRAEPDQSGGGCWRIISQSGATATAPCGSCGQVNRRKQNSCQGGKIWLFMKYSDSSRRQGRYTANEGPVRIQYKCLVPIYVFPEMKLRSVVISKTEV